VRRAAGATGLNLLGVVDAAEYDAMAPAGHRLAEVWPATRSVVMIGNAGPAFWERFRARFGRDPLPERDAHPLDAYTVEAVEPLLSLMRQHGGAARAVFPFFGASDHALSFQRLAIAAGFGVESVLGLILHPDFGPWVALRAAILTDVALRPAGPLPGFDPCTRCPAPCVAVCPGGAFPERRWSLSLCFEAKRTLAPCRSSCLSRLHCVFGGRWRYSEEEMAYHCTYPAGA
jgi:epoxyqueuosine reductase QueG